MEGVVAMVHMRLYLGYTQEGNFREHYIHDGKYKDAIMFGLLEDEYRAVCRPKLVQLMELCWKFSSVPQLP